VLPSLSEAFSNALLEAMGCRCCAIASDTGGNPDLIRDGETGLLFAAGNAESLAERLSQALDDRALRTRLSENALEAVQTRFSREAAARRMGEIYLEFLEKQGRHR
jgi:glycosyltransferase involved in cell wall biosynthesis